LRGRTSLRRLRNVLPERRAGVGAGVFTLLVAARRTVFFDDFFTASLVVRFVAGFAPGRALRLAGVDDFGSARRDRLRFLAGFAVRLGEDFFDAGRFAGARVVFFPVFFMLALRVFFLAMRIYLSLIANVRKGA
jgi:hypothetical protein